MIKVKNAFKNAINNEAIDKMDLRTLNFVNDLLGVSSTNSISTSLRTGCIKGSIFSEVTRLAIYLLFEVFIYYVYLILVLSNYI